jgi:hypothetical protein
MCLSLQDALYETAVEYYTSHSKRVRRKRNRHSQSVSSYNPHRLFPWVLQAPAHYVLKDGPCDMNTRWRGSQSSGVKMKLRLSPSHFRSQRDCNTKFLRHYQDAYATLMIMFRSTAILPPRTKRWAEAKVLADAINVKVGMYALCMITLTTGLD